MNRGEFIGVTLLAIFFLAAGLIFLFWPTAMRDWILKSYVHAGIRKPVLGQKLMFHLSYISALRAAGILAIMVSALLVWFCIAN